MRAVFGGVIALAPSALPLERRRRFAVRFLTVIYPHLPAAHALALQDGQVPRYLESSQVPCVMCTKGQHASACAVCGAWMCLQADARLVQHLRAGLGAAPNEVGGPS